MKNRVWAATGAVLLAALALGASARADDEARHDTVFWTTSVDGAAKPTGAINVVLHAKVADGWHVYALNQVAGGPTPLRVAVEPNAIANANGAAVGSPPLKRHDPSFDLDTEIYSRAFEVTLPLRIAAKTPAGAQAIPVSVRFQTCNDRICQPPKTLHLSAPVTVRAQ